MRSLADVVPERVSAGTSAHVHFVSYNGFNRDLKGEYWVYLEVDEGSYGGRYGKDAIDSCDALVANTRNVPIEEIEWHYPLRVERYELNPEKVAPGKWRGGLGIIRETRFLQDGTVTCEGDRHKERPKGIFGGSDGSSAGMTKNPGSDHPVSLESKLSDEEFAAGDVLQIRRAPRAAEATAILLNGIRKRCWKTFWMTSRRSKMPAILTVWSSIRKRSPVDMEATARLRAD